ncbi:glutamyl-tRNA reductase-binding protein, chloroplastic-like isoform X1 [Zingiber officinale]|uniref:glutamyl-tRNA reductase-binding protein, chloroplastic-like isoform X1 n=1 Tax=Zingiber officinale TaxID=94328 RepID=UPI001C4C6B21|nr:glutamyl-tRNA reductase-binding protein, chloroplastic-like isoform X1 [Zingiber officinale]XP_042440680.1 glutamyl-tRNA reductase-binding protein, chloroplastic-like isoform X1 [Zingiber officinale]
MLTWSSLSFQSFQRPDAMPTLLSLPVASSLPALYLSKFPSPRLASRRSASFPRCSLLSVPTDVPPVAGGNSRSKTSPAEVSRTIVELSSIGTLSSLSTDGWPLSVGARFVVDSQGAPALCLNRPERLFVSDGPSSFHVQFDQMRSRTPQCTLLGRLSKPNDIFLLKRLHAKWEKKYGEELEEELIYLFSVDKVLQIEDLKEDGIWVASSEYINAEPDPLRDFAEKIVDEMNSIHPEDVLRLYSVYVEPGFQQAADTKLIWVDRLGFDMFIYSENAVYSVRIPFPREVTNEKEVKSSFNSMSHLAWEIEKGYATPDFEKVTCIKRVR